MDRPTSHTESLTASGHPVEAGHQPLRPATPKPPWHYALTAEIRQLLERNPSPTSDEINHAAGLAWSIYQTAAYFFPGAQTPPKLDSDGSVLRIPRGNTLKLVGAVNADDSVRPSQYLNIRDDLHQVVGIVKKRYRVHQNQNVPRVLNDLVQQGHADWISAGSLRGGAEVWWLVRLRDAISVGGDPRETIEFHLLLTHSHDGAKKTNLSVLPLRVASQTVLAWPHKRVARTVAIRPGSTSDQESTARVLELTHAYETALERIANTMLDTPITDKEFTALLNRLLPTPKRVASKGRVLNQRGITMAENAKGTITQIYYNNPTIDPIRGTLWGALQAIQYYSDHHSINRTTEASPEENRFKRLTSEASLGAVALALADRDS